MLYDVMLVDHNSDSEDKFMIEIRSIEHKKKTL